MGGSGWNSSWPCVLAVGCVLVFVLPFGTTQTAVCTYYENQTVFWYQPYTVLKVVVSVNSNAVAGSGVSTDLDTAALTNVSFESTLYSPTSPEIVVTRSIEKVTSTSSLPLFKLTTSLTHKASSTSSALINVTVEEEIGNGLQAYWTSTFIPGFGAPGLTTQGRSYLSYTPPSPLTPGNSAVVQFEAEPSGDQGSNLREGVTDFYAYLSFNDSSTSTAFGPFSLPVCLRATHDKQYTIFYEHGMTALTFFVALLVGFLLVVVGVVLYLLISRRIKSSSVSPSQYHEEHRMKEKGKKIVMDPKAALRKGLNVIKDYSIMAWNESIVLILSLKDKLHMFREIDNLDVLATIHMDTDLEQEQNEAWLQASHLLVRGLRHNGDLGLQTEEAALGAFHKDLKDLDKKLEGEYKKELADIYTDLSAKNKEKLAELLQKHRKQKQEVIAATSDVSEKERDALLKLVDKQHQMEDGELTFTLALEQNEGAEKLRKEFAIRKRMGIKELQQSLMSEVISRGQLPTEKADWLMKEHKKQQEAVHRMYDEEISRQRMTLEEKLARRRGLAQQSETQEDDHTDLLNQQISRLMSFLSKGQSVVTAEQSEEWIEELKAQALTVKSQLDSAKESREADLHKRLSQAKVNQLTALEKKHEEEILDYINTNKSKQAEGPVDPMSYVGGLLKLKSQHRLEMAALENKLDAEHAQQLSDLRHALTQGAQDKMTQAQTDIGKKMVQEGMAEKVVAALMAKHEREVEALRNSQEKNRQRQEDNLKEELARRGREWADRREKERREQEELREHEAQIVEKLVNSQVSMSEAERLRIMKEHEKQMVLLENSLTLNKLRQQRSLEERLRQKRNHQLGMLQTKQKTEMSQQQKLARRREEEGGEEDTQAVIALVKKHAQQRLAIMQGQQLDLDEELEQIRIEMAKERALALKTQEERLGAMITALQMEKARERTQIEEQQKAINNLKASLMDDLNQRGILSTPECEKILDIHKQESEVFNKRLETQREKQEMMLRRKLQDRMQQREHVLLAQHEAEMKKLIEGSSIKKFAAKVRRIMLVHRHLLAMEKFKNRLDREIRQTLAHTRQQFEVVKMRKLQEEELSFVAGLVRVGGFSEDELLDVLHMLFPGKEEEDVQHILSTITEGAEIKREGRRNSTIVQRIYELLFVRPSRLFRSDSAQPAKKGGGKQKRQSTQQSSSNLLPGTAPTGTTAPDYPIPAGTLTNNPPGGGVPNPGMSQRRFSQDEAHHGGSLDEAAPDYSQGMDFIAMGASMPYSESKVDRGGSLPPLEGLEISPRRVKKKKKRGLKAMRQDVGEL